MKKPKVVASGLEIRSGWKGKEPVLMLCLMEQFDNGHVRELGVHEVGPKMALDLARRCLDLIARGKR